MKVFAANKILLCLPSLPPPAFNPMENEIDREEEDSWHLPTICALLSAHGSFRASLGRQLSTFDFLRQGLSV